MSNVGFFFSESQLLVFGVLADMPQGSLKILPFLSES